MMSFNMSWLSPITEKLNINALFSSIVLTVITWWFYKEQPLIIFIGCLCGYYLVISYILFIFQKLKDKKDSKRYLQKQNAQKKEEEQNINTHIDIWFAGLSDYKKQELLKLLDWKCLHNASNIIFADTEWDQINIHDYECTINIGTFREPLALFFRIQNNSHGASPTYFVHPYLLQLLYEYKNNQRTLTVNLT